MTLVKPQNLEAERAVIKCLLENRDLIYELNIPLKYDMFFGIENLLVFKAWEELINNNILPDRVLLKTKLIENNQFDIIGGDTYFDKLAEAECITANINEYLDSVVNAYISRCIIDTGNKVTNAGYSEPTTTALDIAYSEMSALLENASFNSTVPEITGLVSSELNAFMERVKNPGSGGILTGLTDYDLLCGGLYETDEVIIAARPSMGKTSLALRLLLNLSGNGIPTMIQSYEMSSQQLIQRLLSMVSKVDLSRIRNGMVETGEYDKVVTAARLIEELPIYIDNNATATVSDIVSTTRKMIRDKGIKILIVDYLQLMPHRIEYATLDLGYIARRFKNLAMDSKIVVIPISQLNRLVEMRAEKEPILSDLRQSGNLEEHSDLVWMIYREEMYKPAPENRGIAKLLIRKNRNGPLGILSLGFEADCVDFVNKETF